MPCRHKSQNDRNTSTIVYDPPNETPVYDPPNEPFSEKKLRSLIKSTISEYWTPKFETFSSDTRKINSEHTAMKSKLDSLTSTINILEDHFQKVINLQAIELSDLQSAVVRLERVPQAPPNSMPIPPPPPPPKYKSPKKDEASQNKAQQAPPSTKPPNSRDQGAPQLGMNDELLAKVARRRKSTDPDPNPEVEEEEWEDDSPPEGKSKTSTNIKGRGMLGKKKGKKLQIFGKQNRYTV